MNDLPVLRAYVGPNMRASVAELARRFEARQGVRVEVVSDEVRKLMARIDAGERADLFVTHDPFLSLAIARGWPVREAWQVASLTPVIIVPRENPAGVLGLEDLGRPGVRVGMTDMANSISGEIVHVMLGRASIREAVYANVVATTTHGRDLAAAMRRGEIDAAIVWNAVAHGERDHLVAIPIDEKWRPQLGVDAVAMNTELGRLELDYVRVTVAMLEVRETEQHARSFAALCASAEGAAVFESNGFAPTDPRRSAISGNERASPK